MSTQPATTPLIRRVPPAEQNTRIGAHDSGTVAGPRTAPIGGYFYAGVGLEPAESAARHGGLAVGGRRCLVCHGSCCSWLRMAATWAGARPSPTLPAKTMQAMPMAWVPRRPGRAPR
jgi:hypothetical protein